MAIDGATPPKLRVGLLVDSLVQPRWVEWIVRDIQDSDFARVTVVVQNGAAPSSVSGPGHLTKRLPHLLYAAYSRVDARLFTESDGPFEPTDLAPLLAGVQERTVAPRQTRFSDYLPDDAVAWIRDQNLDVALRFGFRILRGEALGIARHGVWSYHHGDNRVKRGSPPGFWEVFERDPVTGTVLQILTEDLDNGKVIYRSFASTDHVSVMRSKANFYAKSSSFVMRCLGALARGGETALAETRDEPGGYLPYCNRLYTEPTNVEMAKLLFRHAGRVAGETVRSRLAAEQWMLAYQFTSTVPSLYRMRYLRPPRDRYWADPFPVRHSDRWYIFFEEYLYSTGKGHISVLELDDDGTPLRPRQVLQTSGHLSYPCVFEWEGEHYMVPESADKGRVDLYVATEFPDRWELERTLLDGVEATDPTVVAIDGRWWMFVNVAVPGASTMDELHLFTAETPLGPWQPHPRNPVKSDARSARPAGRLFRRDGKLYRPAQDCGRRYGYAVVIHEVRRIDERFYEEVEVARVEPKWDRSIEGTHTYQVCDGLVVVDASTRRPMRPSQPVT